MTKGETTMARNAYTRTRYFAKQREAELTCHRLEAEYGWTVCPACGHKSRGDQYQQYGCWHCRLAKSGMLKTT